MHAPQIMNTLIMKHMFHRYMQSNRHCMFHKYSAHVRQRYGYTNYAEHGPQRYEYTLYFMVQRDLNSQYMSAHMHTA